MTSARLAEKGQRMTVDGSQVLSKLHVLLTSNLLPREVEKGIELAMHYIEEADLDRCGDGVTVTLADGNELSPHVFEEYETVENATVHLERCIHCGKEEIWWERK